MGQHRKSKAESNKPPRITLKYFWDELVLLLNFEKGLLKALKDLILRPGKTVRTYLYEDRNILPGPLILLITVITIGEIFDPDTISAFFNGEYISSSSTSEEFTFWESIIVDNPGFIMGALLFYISIGFYPFFRKSDYNLLESFVAYIYFSSVYLLTTFLLYILPYPIIGNAIHSPYYVGAIILLPLIYVFIALNQFYSHYPGKVWLRLFFASITTIIAPIILAFVTIVIIGFLSGGLEPLP